MRTIVVVSKLDDWPLAVPGVEVVVAKDYLIDPNWTRERGVRAFNLCRSYRYQSEGYYVSLLGAARRHRPFPALMTVLDMRSRAVIRTADDELEALMQKSLETVKEERIELTVCFGRSRAEEHDRLARKVFDLFPAPLLKATFARGERWRLSSVSPIAFRDVPDADHEFLQNKALEYFTRPRYQSRPARGSNYDLAILHDPKEELAPSGPKTLQRFKEAAETVGFAVELIGRDDYGRLGEFDALFIRETTFVNHHTFRFAQKAESEGLVVIDDPHSILRCTNKVFQTETFELNKIPVPKTWITNRVDAREVAERIGFPCVLKLPDSAFSQGVIKCNDAAELESYGAKALADSDLLLIQEFFPSEFDWRIGIFQNQVLFACRYHMARGHWQIVKKTDSGRYRYGKVDTVPVEDVPPKLLSIALKAAATIGDGLYGVDLKQVDKRIVVTEVNDNPNIDVGCEDAVLDQELYLRIMRGFMERVVQRKSRNQS